MIPSNTTDQAENLIPQLTRRGLSFSLGVSERRILLGFFDVVFINIALGLNLFLQGRYDFERWDPARIVLWFIVLTVFWFVVSAFFEIYNLRKASSTVQTSIRTGMVALVTTAIYQLTPFITAPIPEHRSFLIIYPLMTMLVTVSWRYLYAAVIQQPIFQQTVLVVGAGQMARTLGKELLRNQDVPTSNVILKPLGYIDDNPECQGKVINGIRVLGDRNDLVDLYRRLRPDEIVLAISNSQHVNDELFRALLDCRELGASITMMTTLYEQTTGRVPVENAGRDLYVVLPLKQSISQRLHGVTQRAIDIVFGLIGSVGLVMLIPFIWLANRFTDPGDLFYRQERVGYGGESFDVIKFRSMVMDAEKFTGAVWAEEDDPRITPVGRFVRKTRIDEFPQFWNILKGEMSLIGPRPERPHFVDQLSEDIPYYRLRHAMKPGLTGWAQVNYRYGASNEDSLVKLEYDLYYIKHRSLNLDLQIILKTIQVMFGFKGR